MRLREVKMEVRVQGVRKTDRNVLVIGMKGKIISGFKNTQPLVRFDRSVKGHGYKNREWFCYYRDLRVIG